MYHANRASTALKLQRPDIALQDARYASVEETPAHKLPHFRTASKCVYSGVPSNASLATLEPTSGQDPRA
jgi:hypothetical protein